LANPTELSIGALRQVGQAVARSHRGKPDPDRTALEGVLDVIEPKTGSG
jgi:hypothetical protein